MAEASSAGVSMAGRAPAFSRFVMIRPVQTTQPRSGNTASALVGDRRVVRNDPDIGPITRERRALGTAFTPGAGVLVTPSTGSSNPKNAASCSAASGDRSVCSSPSRTVTRACSSGVERHLDTVEVYGSNPVASTVDQP